MKKCLSAVTRLSSDSCPTLIFVDWVRSADSDAIELDQVHGSNKLSLAMYCVVWVMRAKYWVNKEKLARGTIYYNKEF